MKTRSTPAADTSSGPEAGGFDGPAVVEQLSANRWRVLRALSYQADTQTFTVPVGSTTDFTSVPRPVAWLIPKLGTYARPAILHDHLWRTEAPAGRITYREADAIMRQALRRGGVPFVLRWLTWTGNRWAALLTRERGDVGWWRDAPLVLLWSVCAVPVVAPPAALVALALIIIAIVEKVLWAPLRVLSRHNRVNPPTIDTTT